MTIRIKLYFHLKKYSPAGRTEFVLDLPERAAVADVYRELEMPPDRDHVVLVNGRQAGGDTVLGNNDLVVIFPSIEGG